jgi:peptidyl-prolyl cis-trans isomerase D
MREYFRGLKVILLVVIAAFVATSVVYFGSSTLSNGSSRPNVAGTVNGEDIPVERYRRAQAGIVQAYEQMTRQRMTAELMERLGVAQQVANDLVVDAVIVQTARQEGLRVTDDELRAWIQEMKEFQEDGRFSRDRYLRVLRANRLDPAEFETETRRQLMRRKMEAVVRDGVKVSEAEVREAYERRHERARAVWASMDVTPVMGKITVADQDLEPYVKANQARFTRPERRKIQYVAVRVNAPAVTDQEAEAYYKEHASEFEEPPRVRPAHVLVRVPPVGGSEAENRARAKVEDVIKRAKAGEDFAKLAKEVSEDTANAAKGGDLGLVGSGELVPQFEQVAFSLKKGEVSPTPVRTPFGYHAIKVLEVQEGGVTPFKDAAPRIKQALSAERTERASIARASEVRPMLQAAADFAAEAKKLGLEPRETVVSRGEPIPEVGRDRELEDAVFSLAAGGVSTPIKTAAAGQVVVKVVQQLPAGVPPLPEIRDRVIEAIRRERAEAQVMERARTLASAAKGGDFATLARTDGFNTGELGLFTRSEPPKERGVPGAVSQAALQTAVGEISEPVRTGLTVYVVKTLERQPADPAGFESKRAELEKQALDQKRSAVWEQWIRVKRGPAKVEMATLPAPSVR